MKFDAVLCVYQQSKAPYLCHIMCSILQTSFKSKSVLMRSYLASAREQPQSPYTISVEFNLQGTSMDGLLCFVTVSEKLGFRRLYSHKGCATVFKSAANLPETEIP